MAVKYQCNACLEEKEEEEFYFRNSKLVRPCKECKRAYYREWKAKNPDYHRTWYKENPTANRVYTKKYRTRVKKDKNLVGDQVLTTEDEKILNKIRNS